jgi:hypothetical protein
MEYMPTLAGTGSHLPPIVMSTRPLSSVWWRAGAARAGWPKDRGGRHGGQHVRVAD